MQAKEEARRCEQARITDNRLSQFRKFWCNFLQQSERRVQLIIGLTARTGIAGIDAGAGLAGGLNWSR